MATAPGAQIAVVPVILSVIVGKGNTVTTGFNTETQPLDPVAVKV